MPGIIASIQSRCRPPSCEMLWATLCIERSFVARVRLFFWRNLGVLSGGSLLGNHHPPWEFTGMLRPVVIFRWRCQHLHSGVFSRMNTCSGRAAMGTVSSQHRPLSHVPAHRSGAQDRGRLSRSRIAALSVAESLPHWALA